MLTRDGAGAVDVRGGDAVVVAVVALPREPTIIPLPAPPPHSTKHLFASSRVEPLPPVAASVPPEGAVKGDDGTGGGGSYREVLLDGLEGVALERDEHVLELLGEHFCMGRVTSAATRTVPPVDPAQRNVREPQRVAEQHSCNEARHSPFGLSMSCPLGS